MDNKETKLRLRIGLYQVVVIASALLGDHEVKEIIHRALNCGTEFRQRLIKALLKDPN